MGVPLSDFIKIRRSSNDVQTMESDVRDAVKNLINYTHEVGTVTKLDNTNETGMASILSTMIQLGPKLQ